MERRMDGETNGETDRETDGEVDGEVAGETDGETDGEGPMKPLRRMNPIVILSHRPTETPFFLHLILFLLHK